MSLSAVRGEVPSKILIVDDFEAFRRFVGSLLQQRGPFEIEEACDGLEAVRKAEQFAPDLILLDIGLPKLNGLEVAARVNNLVPAAKILFFSVEFSAEVVQDALNLGALGFVDKSRAHSDLLPAIARVLSGKRFVSNGLAVGEGAEAQDSHTHEVLFCSNDEVLLDGLTHFIAAALNVGNAAIVWASESHRNALVDRLQALRVDIAGAMQRGI